MEFLGIGPLELVLILVIALLVFGPDKLPEIGAQLGRSVRELRSLSREITQNVNTLVNEPLDELRKPINEAGQVVQDIAKAADTVRNPTQALHKAIAGQLAAQTASSALADNTPRQANQPQSGELAAAASNEPLALPTEAETTPAPASSPTDPGS